MSEIEKLEAHARSYRKEYLRYKRGLLESNMLNKESQERLEQVHRNYLGLIEDIEDLKKLQDGEE